MRSACRGETQWTLVRAPSPSPSLSRLRSGLRRTLARHDSTSACCSQSASLTATWIGRTQTFHGIGGGGGFERPGAGTSHTAHDERTGFHKQGEERRKDGERTCAASYCASANCMLPSPAAGVVTPKQAAMPLKSGPIDISG